MRTDRKVRSPIWATNLQTACNMQTTEEQLDSHTFAVCTLSNTCMSKKCFFFCFCFLNVQCVCGGIFALYGSSLLPVRVYFHEIVSHNLIPLDPPSAHPLHLHSVALGRGIDIHTPPSAPHALMCIPQEGSDPHNILDYIIYEFFCCAAPPDIPCLGSDGR